MENTSDLSNAPQLWMLDILHRFAVIHFQPVSGERESEDTHAHKHALTFQMARGRRRGERLNQ